ILLAALKVLAWYFLSPDMFRSEATDTLMGSGSASRIEDRTRCVRLIVTRFVGIQLVTQRASGKIKLHEVKAHGRVSKISAEVDYGFIATPVVKSPQTHFV